MPTVFGREYPAQYDAIIIGSGIGGLFCGNILAKAGLKVLLLERHYMLGGFCSTFRRRGFIFDAATHFYPLLGNPTTLTGKLLQDLDIPTEWVKMDPVDQVHLPSMPSFSVPADFGRGLEKRGGRILKCASVDKIVIDNNQAQGVRISTVSKRPPEYHEFRAPIVISNADALHTYENLIGEEHCGRWPIEHLKSLAPSFPCFLTHLGLRGMDPKALAAAEGYYWTSYDPIDAIRSVFKIFIPTHFDTAIAPPGCQILIVQKLTPVRIENITDWPAHKAAVEGQIMGRLRQILPGLDEHIVVKLSATAMTSNRVTNNWHGAMLGWAI